VKTRRRAEIALDARFATLILPVLVLGLVLSVEARAKDTGYIFVSNEKTNNIAVIDPKQDYKILKWIATSHRPRDMKFRDDHRVLYVACGDDDVIDVIDVATLEVADHIPTGPSPEMFDLSRDGKALYVSNEEGSSVQEVNVADKIIVREIATGAEPEGIAISADGQTLYVTSEVTDMVHVIDAEAGVVMDNIVVGTRPRRLLLLPDGKELWVSNELSGQVSVIDRAANRVSTTLDFLPPGFRQVDVTRRHDHDPGWEICHCRARTRQPRRLRRYSDKEGRRLCAGRKPCVGCGAQSRRKDALCRQRAERRSFNCRHGKPQGHPVGAGRPRAAFGSRR
jgi:YVTN family beta-propeller protein